MGAPRRYVGTFNFEAPKELRTERLTLRRPEARDRLELFSAFTSDADIVRFLPFRSHANIAETSSLIDRWQEHFHKRSSFAYVIEVRKTMQLAGVIELHPDQHRAAFDCNIVRTAQGKGYATEACSAVADWALKQPGVWRVECLCAADNIAAARTLEKAGLQYEGLARRLLMFPNHKAEPVDCKVFSKVRET